MGEKRLSENSEKFNDINYIRKRITTSKNHKLFSYIIIIFILAIIYVWERVEIDEVSLNTNRLKEEKSTLVSFNEILKAEIENKSRFESIEKIAKNKLGMDFPGNNSVLLVIDNSDKKSIYEKAKELIKKSVKSF